MNYQSNYGTRNKETQILQYSTIALGKWFHRSESLSSFVKGEHHGNAVMCKQMFGFKIYMHKIEEYMDNTSATSEAVPTKTCAIEIW